MLARRQILAVGAAAFIGAAALSGGAAQAVEEPAYTVLRAEDRIEIRDYAPMIVAEVVVAGDRRDAVGDGFRILAKYIFEDERPEGEIAMTAPVSQTLDAQPTADGRWKVRFVMPSEWSMETLPAPDDPRVTLFELPPQRMASIRFAGYAGSDSIARFEGELKDWLAAEGLTPSGAPVYAYYNPPWTLGPFRRNEVLIALAE